MFFFLQRKKLGPNSGFTAVRGRGRIQIHVCVSDLQLGFLVIPSLSDSSHQYLLDGFIAETMIKQDSILQSKSKGCNSKRV